MRRTMNTILVTAAFGATAAFATARDVAPPDWRGVDGSICFGWTATDASAPFNLYNDLVVGFNDPSPYVDIGPRIIPIQLPDGWLLNVDTPNMPGDSTAQAVRVQLTWVGTPMVDALPSVEGLTAYTISGPASAKLVDQSPVRVLKDDYLGGGWRSYDFIATGMPMWDRTTIFVPTGYELTGIMIDAGPIPTPASLTLLGIGAAFAARRRR
jgi:MYXO-CTERM domain-containing protein